jgi:hypothetical protein
MMSLSTTQLAERWALNPNTLRKWRISDFGPPYFKLGTGRTAAIRYRIEDIEDFERKYMHMPSKLGVPPVEDIEEPVKPEPAKAPAPAPAKEPDFSSCWANAVFHGRKP